METEPTGIPEDKPSTHELNQEAIRSEMTQRIESMMTSGLGIDAIAELLDAHDFVHVQPTRSSHVGPMTVFDVQAFVSKSMERDQYLRLPTTTSVTDAVLLPPDEGKIETGSGQGFREVRHVPRSRYLIELLVY